MLLAIDAGNTNIVFALFDGEKVKVSWRCSTRAQQTADEYASFLTPLMAEAQIKRTVKAAIIASVVPEANFHLAKLCRDHFNCEPLMVGDPALEVGIEILLDRPEEIGADRIVNAVGGTAAFKPPLLIVDFGTATTFDVVDGDGNYQGGAIAPGINLSLQALHMAAAKLPRIGIAPSKRVIGKNTNEAIQSGIYWGYTGLIEGLITRIKNEFGNPMTVIATGGLARLFAGAVSGIDHFDSDLTLRGLYKIYERNSSPEIVPMSHHKKDPHRPPDDALWYLALGGAGEIGMNLSLYGTAGKWLMVDCGITFGDETTPGIDVIMPDIDFITERRDDLVGLIITHGHEDHIGAIEHLWPHFQCPVYATRFTAELIRAKTDNPKMKSKIRLIELPIGGGFEIGPFKGEFITVTHSIPESNMLAITTKHGTVLHTGDWKFDPEPLVGNVTDDAKLKELGRNKLMALIGDSTNALVPGHSGSERTVRDEFYKLFGTIKKRIVVACFSSNIARLKSICAAARKQGRHVTLVGRSLWRNAEIAEACGYLPEFSDFLTENEAMLSPRDKVVLICTGCQGEPRSALWRIAMEDHPEVELDAGDTVIFSSRDIPGNEKPIGRLQNQLIARGLTVITQEHAPVHVSGHPAQDELTQLFQWTRPHLVLPVHGEARHQMEHARIAKECQVPHTLIPANGQIVRLGPGVHEIVAEVPSGRLGLDGKKLRRMDREVTKNRRKMSHNGAVVITLVMDRRGTVMQDPQIALLGLTDTGQDTHLAGDIMAAVLDAIKGMPKSTKLDDAAVRHAAAQGARKYMQEHIGKKPVMDVHVVRV